MIHLALIGGVLLLAVGGAGAFALLAVPPEDDAPPLRVPFAVLPVPAADPAVRAQLHRIAAQTSWMDAAVLRTVLLVYPDGDVPIRALCEDMARDYAVFSAVSRTDAAALLDVPEAGHRDGNRWES